MTAMMERHSQLILAMGFTLLAGHLMQFLADERGSGDPSNSQGGAWSPRPGAAGSEPGCPHGPRRVAAFTETATAVLVLILNRPRRAERDWQCDRITI